MNIKRLLQSLTAASAILFASVTAQAAIINITNNGGSLVGDVQMNAVLGNNNPATNFDWLAGLGDFLGEGVVDGYNAITSSSLPTPIFADYSDAGNVNPFDITGYAYAVLHYGSGKDGSPSGGIVAYYLNGMTGEYSFPNPGLGPNGYGGLSSVRLFKGETTTTKVPDATATLMLLALGLTGVGIAARRKV